MAKEKKEKWFYDEFTILDGRVTIGKTKASGNKWQMRCWIKEAQQYYRRSLRTPSKDEAIEIASDTYFDLITKARNGEVIFDKTAKELVDAYMEFKQKQVGNITQGRVTTLRSQLKHYLKFVGEKTKLNTIPSYRFNDYHQFRRNESPTVRSVTLLNEGVTIRNLYDFGTERGWVDRSRKPVFPRIKKSSMEKIHRDALTGEEYEKIYRYMRGWHNKVTGNDIDERRMIRYFVILLANTGLRFGEARNLRWSDVKALKNKINENELDIRIYVRSGKTGERHVVGRRGDMIAKIKKISNYTKPLDYIFCDNDSGEPISKKAYYKHWNQMLDDTGLDGLDKQVVYYSLRHTYATWSLYKGVDVFTLSKNMGCSVKYIEEHYGHVEVDKQRPLLTKNMSNEIREMLR